LNTFLGSKLGNFAAGYAMAKYVRFNSSLLGGSVNCSSSGSPKQVDVTINYPQPIFMPGFAEMWNFVTGDKIYYGMKSLRQGLGGIPGKLLPVYETMDQAPKYEDMLAKYDPGLAGSISSFVSSIPVVMLPYINVQSKCSTGYSDWGSKDPDYRPRMPASGDESDSSGKTDNPDVNNAGDKAEKTKKDQEDYKAAVPDAKDKCTKLCAAQNNLSAAHGRDDPIINDPNAKAEDKAKAQADLQKYVDAHNAAVSANTAAQNKLESSRSAVQQDTGQSMPSVPCGCH